MTLSDKIMGDGKKYEEYWTDHMLLDVSDVKEFIKELKEEMEPMEEEGGDWNFADVCELINHLAGDKLI